MPPVKPITIEAEGAVASKRGHLRLHPSARLSIVQSNRRSEASFRETKTGRRLILPVRHRLEHRRRGFVPIAGFSVIVVQTFEFVAIDQGMGIEFRSHFDLLSH